MRKNGCAIRSCKYLLATHRKNTLENLRKTVDAQNFACREFGGASNKDGTALYYGVRGLRQGFPQFY